MLNVGVADARHGPEPQGREEEEEGGGRGRGSGSSPLRDNVSSGLRPVWVKVKETGGARAPELEGEVRGLPRPYSLRRERLALWAPSFTSAPPPPALFFLPEKGFPPVWTRGEDALGCAGSLRALEGGQISRGGGSPPGITRTLGSSARLGLK